MKKIIKYFEFFDTEDIKTSHEIDLLKKIITKSSVVNQFEKQSPFQPIYATLIYRFKFFKETLKSNKYAFVSQPSPKIFLINFKNEQVHIIISIELLDNKKYNMNIIYIPNGINQEQYTNWITITTELLEIKRDKIINQEFKNLDINEIIIKINNILLPIMKEFGFTNLINSYRNDYDINKN